jgi:L-lactate dehydrogenase complex protein LldG
MSASPPADGLGTSRDSGAREAVLGRIRSALGPDPVVPTVPRACRAAGTDAGGAAAVLDRFCERTAEYRATLVRVSAAELEAALAEACAARGTRRVVAAAGVDVVVPGAEVTVDDGSLSARELDGYDASLTGCALAIAETGTVVLDGGPACGRRALTLIPDHHLCVVRADQVVAGVPDAIAALEGAAVEGRPITFVSGPSATSDIELERVEGVHGPRLLDVFVIEA